jgi:hypothetical protein
MSDAPQPAKIRFDYLKSNFFRTARVDGAGCSLNSQGDLVLSVFSERVPIPQRSVYSMEGPSLGQEIVGERIQRDAIIREVEIALSMNVEVAKSLRTLLDAQIALVEEHRTKRNSK